VSTRLQPPEIPEGMRAIKIRADAKFWRHWHGNKDQMRQIGYRCRKVGARWHAWLLIRDGEAEPDLFGKAA
jgi:hypothetical protein